MKVESFGTSIALISLCTAHAFAGPEWREDQVGDAGNLPGGAQVTMGDGAITRIIGDLQGVGLASGDHDFQDMYVIQITDPAAFSASTAEFLEGLTEFDSHLYLFAIDGLGLLGNDNTSAPFGACCVPDKSGTFCIDTDAVTCIDVFGGTFFAGFTCNEIICDEPPSAAGSGPISMGSSLTNMSNDGTDIVITEPGLYLLAISISPSQPQNKDGLMYDFASSTEISGPDGPGGSTDINGWTPPAASAGPIGGHYEIALAGVGFAAPPAAVPAVRIAADDKGSLFIHSKVEIRWDSTGAVVQDTFVSLLNDYPEEVLVQMYFVNGDAPLDAVVDANGEIIERAHPGWNWADVAMNLTQNQPVYWSALTGLPQGVTPFTALDPGFPPGRPDPDGSTDRVLRGFIVGWAINSANAQIRWNHLSGSATIVNYSRGAAWEYKAWTSPVVDPAIANGDPVGTPGIINLDGAEYAPGFDLLLLDFYAVGSSAFSGGGRLVTLNTDLTLHPIAADLRQETAGPVCTKATFEVWNENEFKFTGLELCICCWSQRLLSNYPAPNHTLLQNLQTDKGKARIDGLASQLCFIDFDPNDGLPIGADPRDILSIAASLLGVESKQLTFDNGLDFAADGSNLTGMGAQNATIQYDLGTGEPPEQNDRERDIANEFDALIQSLDRR